jgi:hypothetical protein
MITGWRYYFRRYLGWFPLQPCITCRRWYWGGLPYKGWEACDQECCSKECAKSVEWL